MSSSAFTLLGGSGPAQRTVHPVQMALDFGGFFRNKIVNGDFNVNDNGTSFSTPANGAETLDKWIVTYDGTIGAFTVSQQSHTIGQTNVPDEPEFFYRWNQTSAGSGSSFRRIEQQFQPVRCLAGKTATVTLYIKADSSRNVTVDFIQNFGSGGSATVVTSGGTLSVTSSWQKFSVDVVIPSISGKTIGTGNFFGLRLGLPINSSMTIDVSHVQVEENGQTNFEQRPLFFEQLLCFGSGSVSSVDASGGVETVAGSAITSTGTIRGAQTVRTQTGTSDTFLTGDRGKLVTHTNASAIAATLPQAGASFPSGWFVDVQNRGAGTLTITPTTSTIDGAASLDLTTGRGCRIFSDGTNYFTMRGGSPDQVIPVHGVLQFTANGTFTVPAATTTVWIQAAGGGGGGGSSTGTGGAGGGGSGFNPVLTVVTGLTPGATHAVTIGAGGAGGSGGGSNNSGTDGGTTSVGALYTQAGGSGSVSCSSSTVGVGGVGSGGFNGQNGRGSSTGGTGGGIGGSAGGGSGTNAAAATANTGAGGGGGGQNSGGSGGSGGAGGSGFVNIFY